MHNYGDPSINFVSKCPLSGCNLSVSRKRSLADEFGSPIIRSETPFTMNASHPFLNTTAAADNPHDEDINKFSKH